MTDLEKIFKLIYQENYLILISIFFFILIFITISNTLDFSALLTSILQSLATLLAIITAFTLVAVQLSAQTYGSRVLKIFSTYDNNKFFWRLILLYLASMIITMFVLISMPLSTITIENISIISRFEISVAVLLTFWSFISIPAFIIDTIRRLQPDEIINNIYNELMTVSKSKFDDIKSYDDRIVSLVDIIDASIIRGHTDMAELGLDKLKDYYMFLEKNRLINETNVYDILKYFLKHYKRLSRSSIDVSDDTILSQIIENTSDMGFFSIQKSTEIFSLMMNYYNEISKTMVENELEESIGKIFYYFEEKYIPIFKIRAIRGSRDFRIISFLNSMMDFSNNLWEYSVEQNKLKIIEKIENRLNYLIRQIAGSGLYGPINNEIQFLKHFAIYNAKTHPYLLFFVVDKFNNLFWKLDSDRRGSSHKTEDHLQNLIKLIISITDSIREIGMKSIKYKLHEYEWDYYKSDEYSKPEAIYWVLNNLESIALRFLNNRIYEKYDFDKTIISSSIVGLCIMSLKEIGIELINEKSDLIKDVLKSLEKIGFSENYIDDHKSSVNVLDSLTDIGTKLVEAEFIGNISELAQILVKIGIIGKDRSITQKSAKILENLFLDSLCNAKLQEESLNILINLNSILVELIENKEEETAKVYLKILIKTIKKLRKNCPNNSIKNNFKEASSTIRDLSKKNGMNNLVKELDQVKESSYAKSKHKYTFYE